MRLFFNKTISVDNYSAIQSFFKPQMEDRLRSIIKKKFLRQVFLHLLAVKCNPYAKIVSKKYAFFTSEEVGENRHRDSVIEKAREKQTAFTYSFAQISKKMFETISTLLNYFSHEKNKSF